LRRHGTRWEASVKWEGQGDGVIHARPELTVQLASSPSFPFTLPPGPLVDQLSKLIAAQPLTPILISDVHRQRFAVLAAQQAKDPAFAELALDEVHLRAPDLHTSPVSTYWEVEIELETKGAERDLHAFVGLLQQRFSLTPSDGGKFHRGLTLLYGPGLIGGEVTSQRPVSRQRLEARKKAKTPTLQQ
jgi:inorganic triphosphatase YgiF